MRKFIYIITVLFLFVSCNKDVQKETNKTNTSKDKHLLSNPNIFVGKHQAKAMVLGVFHFHNPGLDSYKEKYHFNILEEKRQQELDVLLDKIAAYKPTKILLERSRVSLDSITKKQYNNFLDGSFNIDDKKNEVYQIGFKLAKMLNHNTIYCSDASANWFGADLDWDNYDQTNYLKSKGQYEKSIRYDYNSFYERSDSLKSVQTLTEHLAFDNNLENRLKDHQAYLTEVIIEGAGDNYLGADGVARWYRRNLRIFANSYDLTDFDKEERLLLIYGSGHVWQLSQLFKDSPDFEYVDATNYLKD